MATIVTRAGKGSALTWTEGDANITNLNNDKIELTDLSVGAEGTASGNGSISYNNTTGVFTFTPADADEASRTTTIYGKAAESIAKGDVVMFGGVQGDHILLKKADASATGFIADWVIGVASEALVLNDFSYVVTQGEITDIDTATDFTVGDILFLDPTTAGGLTATEPTAPNPKIKIAAVTKEDAAEGIILVRPSRALPLEDLQDVYIASTPSDGQVLNWDNSNSRWAPATITQASGNELENVSEDTTPQLGGDLDGQGNTVSDVQLEDYKETVYSLGSTDSPSIDATNGNVQTVTITSGLAIPTISNFDTGASMTLIINGSGDITDSTTGTIALFANAGSKTITTNGILSIFNDGSNYYCSLATDFTS